MSCWGTGELRQYDVSDPFAPKLTATAQIGGIVRRAAHPAKPNAAAQRRAADGGAEPRRPAGVPDQRTVLARGTRSSIPTGIDGWMVKLDTRPEGGMAMDPKFFLEMEQGLRSHQVRLQGGDASSDTFCFSS